MNTKINNESTSEKDAEEKQKTEYNKNSLNEIPILNPNNFSSLIKEYTLFEEHFIKSKQIKTPDSTISKSPSVIIEKSENNTQKESNVLNNQCTIIKNKNDLNSKTEKIEMLEDGSVFILNASNSSIINNKNNEVLVCTSRKNGENNLSDIHFSNDYFSLSFNDSNEENNKTEISFINNIKKNIQNNYLNKNEIVDKGCLSFDEKCKKKIIKNKINKCIRLKKIIGNYNQLKNIQQKWHKLSNIYINKNNLIIINLLISQKRRNNNKILYESANTNIIVTTKINKLAASVNESSFDKNPNFADDIRKSISVDNEKNCLSENENDYIYSPTDISNILKPPEIYNLPIIFNVIKESENYLENFENQAIKENLENQCNKENLKIKYHPTIDTISEEQNESQFDESINEIDDKNYDNISIDIKTNDKKLNKNNLLSLCISTPPKTKTKINNQLKENINIFDVQKPICDLKKIDFNVANYLIENLNNIDKYFKK